LEIGNDPRLKRPPVTKASAAEQANQEEQSDTPSDGNGNDLGADDHDVGEDDIGEEESITDPGKHDVLCGRGGGTNNHSGNVMFRTMVNEHKLRYLAASKAEKPKVAAEVVKLWRAQEPPGRFLSRKDKSRKGPGSVKAEGNVWYDVGDKKAREKASQCLRERTPDVIPFVREIQRQQDILTGQGLLYVEQQMKQRGGTSPSPANSTPEPAPTAQPPPPAPTEQPPPAPTLPAHQSQDMTQAEVANALLLGRLSNVQQGGSVPPPANSIPQPAPSAQPPMGNLPVYPSQDMTQAEVVNAFLLGHFAANGFSNNFMQQGGSVPLQHAPTSQLPLYPSQDMTQAEIVNAFLLGQFASNGFANNNVASLFGPTNPFNLSHLATEATLTATAVNGNANMYTGNQNPPAHGFSLSNDTTTTTTSPKRPASKKSGPNKKRKRKKKA
jgi:hypothetical protein